jgi:hypothetical protein
MTTITQFRQQQIGLVAVSAIGQHHPGMKRFKPTFLHVIDAMSPFALVASSPSTLLLM